MTPTDPYNTVETDTGTTARMPSALLRVSLAGRKDEQVLMVEVEVLEIRSNYGRKDCLIRPLRGKGEVWVAESSLTGIETQEKK